jgi:imidazoleglycerol-phosphate dehydratase
MPRLATTQRSTTETTIRATVNLDGTGQAHISTGIGFLDHMLELFAKHGQVDLDLEAQGDLHVDGHHTTEDVGICIGQAIATALGDKAGIARYGFAILPMDETLVQIALDLSGRTFLVFRAPCPAPRVGDFDTELLEEFCQALASNLKCNLHVVLQHGRNSHHICEAVFKGIARALRMAIQVDPNSSDIPSTKGSLS